MRQGPAFSPAIRRFILALIVLLAGAALPRATAQDQAGAAEISAPRSGELLVGVVLIQGTASSPDFQRYKLEFALQGGGAETLWFPITEITQQVTSGTLAQWNTLNVPDGTYQIRLRVILRDGSVLQAGIQDLNVANDAQTPLPTPPPAPTAFPTPTEGPTPTALIVQPPTATPRPPLATLPAAGAASDEDMLAIARYLESVQGAFCGGIVFAVVGAGIVTLYRAARVRMRARWRR